MISRAQQILLKRAQAEAGIDDVDYREAIETISGVPGCRSSKDPRLTDRHVDNLLAFFEAIHWKEVDAGALQPSCKPAAVFRQRGYWAAKNPMGNTSRDRFGESNIQPAVDAAESELNKMGYGLAYLCAIQNHIQPFSLAKYLGALNRTLRAKRAAATRPF